jgi:hypothetical protein
VFLLNNQDWIHRVLFCDLYDVAFQGDLFTHEFLNDSVFLFSGHSKETYNMSIWFRAKSQRSPFARYRLPTGKLHLNSGQIAGGIRAVLRFLDDFFIYIPRHFIFILVQMTNGY